MRTRPAIALVLGISVACLSSSSSDEQIIPSSAHCRHDLGEQPADRTRREAALAFAKAIHAEQGALAERSRRYHALAELRTLPPMPAGFDLRFYSDAKGYLFALKDTLDSCRYAVFSDESGLLYEKSARSAPVVANRVIDHRRRQP